METSPFAYEHALRTMRKNTAFAKRSHGGAMADAQSTNKVEAASAGYIYGPLLWLYHLFIRLAVGGSSAHNAASDKPDMGHDAFIARYSRGTRRMITKERLFLNMRKLKIKLYIERLMFAGLSPRQAQEKRARLSPRGRISVYGLRYWGTRSQDRARLKCYDHGWWSMPSTSTVAGGMWEVQLAPN